MADSTDATERDPIDVLIEQFLLRRRAGEAIEPEAFAAAHPEHATELRSLLPASLALEQWKRERSEPARRAQRLELPPLERLGDFRIVREVGRGGMGVVFEAVQESLGRRVALKVLPQAALLTPDQLQRFQREASVAARLHHSHIVPVFGSGQSDGFHWYAMQFIAGQSLDQWRRERAAAPPRDAAGWREHARRVARIGAQAASALAHAHAQRTLHRDVKPANLLLERGEHVWVADFGLAKALEVEGLTQASDLLGTLQYMAPEQFAGRYDERSEVHALGVTLYELLLLRPAFSGRTRSEIVEQVRSQRPPALLRERPELPPDLAVVVERAMAREPGDRYPGPRELAADLEAFLDDRPIAARRHNAAQLLWRWCRRNRAVAALAACALLAGVGAAVTGWVAYGVTDEALGREKSSAELAARQTALVASNLELTLAAFGELFDELVGRDPALAFDEDPDTGEQTVVAQRAVEPRDVELLQRMLAFYDRFAAANADNQALRFEAARARRRVGAIQARLGDLDAAADSYLDALTQLLAVQGRDVRREIASVHVDLGQLEQRRGQVGEAVQRFQQALAVLGPDDAGDPRALRFERAQAHFLLARRPGPPGRIGERLAERLRAETEQHLAAAQAILGDLLAAEPQNPELRALQARCRLEAGRRGGPAGRADREAAIQMFRQLVTEHPEAQQYSYELCEALVANARRVGGAADAPPLDELREARDLAQRLLEQQPGFAEYQLLRAGVGSALGRHLVRAAAQDPGRSAELRGEAEAELRAALAVPVPEGERDTWRHHEPQISARTTLCLLLLDTDRRELAAAEAEAIVATLRALAQGARANRRPPPEPQFAALFDAALRRLGRSELLREWRELRERLGVGERPGGPPRRPR